METFIKALMEYGLLGLMTALMLYLFYRKDKELTEEKDKRLCDAKDMLNNWYKLSAELQNTLKVLVEISGGHKKT